MSKKYYTGVGSRDTPDFVCKFMEDLAIVFADTGYVLRSGHAPGADLAFENGVDTFIRLAKSPRLGLKEIWIPWNGFNGSSSRNLPTVASYDVASQVHPVWFKLKDSHKALHARNANQVLGEDLKTPSSFLICWTEGGEPSGGTRTAIMIAKAHNVPTLNLGKWSSLDSMKEATQDFLMLIGEDYEI